jgi:hypothetical protein
MFLQETKVIFPYQQKGVGQGQSGSGTRTDTGSFPQARPLPASGYGGISRQNHVLPATEESLVEQQDAPVRPPIHKGSRKSGSVLLTDDQSGGGVPVIRQKKMRENHGSGRGRAAVTASSPRQPAGVRRRGAPQPAGPVRAGSPLPGAPGGGTRSLRSRIRAG